MTMQSAQPLVVSASPLGELALSNLRIAVLAAGAFAAGRGWLKDEEVARSVPFAMIVLPWAWGQYSRFRLWLKAKVAASFAPDSVARVK